MWTDEDAVRAMAAAASRAERFRRGGRDLGDDCAPRRCRSRRASPCASGRRAASTRACSPNASSCAASSAIARRTGRRSCSTTRARSAATSPMRRPVVRARARRRSTRRRRAARANGVAGGYADAPSHPRHLQPRVERWPAEHLGGLARDLARRFGVPVARIGRGRRSRRRRSSSRPPAARLSHRRARRRSARSARSRNARARSSRWTAGPMHVAAAVGAPTVGIFAMQSDEPDRWRPLGAEHRDRAAVVSVPAVAPQGDVPRFRVRARAADRAASVAAAVRGARADARRRRSRCARRIQLCTYNRAALLERVLDACFEQTRPVDAYEVVLVNDGSSDGRPAVIEARARAARPAPSPSSTRPTRVWPAAATRASRARAASGSSSSTTTCCRRRLSSPSTCARTSAPRRDRARRGRSTPTSFDDTPAADVDAANYSGNYFWTTNVSVPLATTRAASAASARRFEEYGWEDIELGLRLRFAGVPSLFNPRRAGLSLQAAAAQRADVDGMCARPARRRARRVQLRRMHPHWRVVLATGDDPVRLRLHARAARAGVPRARRERVCRRAPRRPRAHAARAARRRARWPREAYYEELDAARRTAP